MSLFHKFNVESILTDINEYCDLQGKEFISFHLRKNDSFIERESNIEDTWETDLNVFVKKQSHYRVSRMNSRTLEANGSSLRWNC